MINLCNRGLRKIPTWVLYVIAPVAPIWLFYLAVTGALGVEPIQALEHKIGELGLQVLIFTLAITPMRKYIGLNLLKFRRALGLIGFFYVFLHLLVWLLLDVRILDQIIDDIFKRPFITIGMISFVLMIPLAITSNNLSIRKLGPKWRKLHKLTYLATFLGGVHYVMVVKGWQIEPMIYTGVILALLLTRISTKKLRSK